MRIFFKDHQAAQAPGWVNRQFYELPPDIDAQRQDYDLVAFDMEVGDCLVFDMRLLHGAPAGVIPARTRRRFTVRLAAQDGRIRYRGDWAAQERALFEAAGHRDGDELDSEFFPRLWPVD